MHGKACMEVSNHFQSLQKGRWSTEHSGWSHAALCECHRLCGCVILRGSRWGCSAPPEQGGRAPPRLASRRRRCSAAERARTGQARPAPPGVGGSRLPESGAFRGQTDISRPRELKGSRKRGLRVWRWGVRPAGGQPACPHTVVTWAMQC
uniref:Uncharacterized protein n=1 Tax=Amazona collaria TaxID=241587 RepID=A0A8B9G203_9PSIT